MAPSVAESATRYLEKLTGLMESRPGRLAFALRLALICTITGLVTEIYQTPDAALTMYVVFFLSQKDRATSVIMNFVFLLLITFIISFTFVVVRYFIHDSMSLVISIATISFSFLFLSSASKARPVGNTIALIVGYALDLLGTVSIGELATRALLYTWLFIALPVGISIVVNLLIATPPRRLAEQTIAWRLRLAAAMVRSPNSRDRARFTEALRDGNIPIDGWLRLAGVEKTASPKDIAALRQAAASTLALLSDVDMLDRYPDAALPPALCEHIAWMLEEIAGILSLGGYPVEISWEGPDPDSGLSPLSARVFADIKESLVRFTDVPDTDAASPAPAKAKGGFFAEDAFTNPDHVYFALKTTGAAMFCYFLYSLLDWPGIHTCFITCYIVALGTAAESVEKLSLRIVGCLIGAAAGYAAIVYVLPALTSIGALMIVVFLGAFGAAYVAVGSPRISYAGFQIAFAFFLCTVQGPAPAFDLKIARDRVVGIIIGNLVSYFVLTRLWPVSVTRHIDPEFVTLLRCLSKIAGSAAIATRRALASEGQAALGIIETDLYLAHYEPKSLHPSQSWLQSREIAAREIGALEPPLLLDADKNAAMRIAILADAIEAPGTIRPLEAEAADPPPGPLRAIIDDHLQNLERALAHTDRSELTVEHYAPA